MIASYRVEVHPEDYCCLDNWERFTDWLSKNAMVYDADYKEFCGCPAADPYVVVESDNKANMEALEKMIHLKVKKMKLLKVKIY